MAASSTCGRDITTLLCSFLFSLPAFADCTVLDDTGRSVHLQQPAKRIISLAPDVTETLYAIGAGSQVVATIAASDYPDEAKKLPRVGSYSGLDVEAILALKPDLIVTWGSHFSAALNKLPIVVYVTQPKQLQDVATSMHRLGCLSGREAAADHAARQFLAGIAQLKRDHRHQAQKKVFFQIGDGALFTINKESWINQVLALCGGENIFQNARLISPQVNEEAVLMANPAVIFSDANNDDWQKRWRRFPQLQATKNNRLITVQPDWIDRAGPRLLLGATFICHKI